MDHSPHIHATLRAKLASYGLPVHKALRQRKVRPSFDALLARRHFQRWRYCTRMFSYPALCWRNAGLLLGFLYPVVSKRAVQLFAHKRLGGTTGTLLSADLSYVVADARGLTPGYVQILPAGIVFVLLYPIGIPLTFMWFLWRNRFRVNRIEHPGVQARLGAVSSVRVCFRILTLRCV